MSSHTVFLGESPLLYFLFYKINLIAKICHDVVVFVVGYPIIWLQVSEVTVRPTLIE